MKNNQTHIAIFAKEPVPGWAKTRLIPTLGAEAAAALHAKLVEHAVVVALHADLGPVALWVAGVTGAPFFQYLENRYNLKLRSQCSGDLGQRMAAVFAQAQAPLLLMGSDCPIISPQLLQHCARALGSHDAVLLPAEDGGYGLIGLQEQQPQLFEAIAWGSDSVLASTRQILQSLKLTWSEPDTIWDLDRPADFKRLEQDVELYQQVMGY